ncbi:MAG: nicotinate phosphoribosyltransferase [Clostridia bacterium]|jgi:nicotinate phosphoribosyltransferase
MKKLDWSDTRNLTMLMDFYELTMANGYMESGLEGISACFDMSIRRIPDGGGFAIMAGLEQVIENLKELRFKEKDIEFLRSKNLFSDKFLEYLRNFKFSCDVWAVPEGTPVFPNEPIVKVVGPIVEAQLLETLVLVLINHQSLIATKSNRIVRAAQGRAVMEFGSRRAHGADSAIYGARAAYIAGCVGTSCVLSSKMFGIPALGTMAHSWVQLFDTELDAFLAYARAFPSSCTLLVDTYDVLRSGIPNAIKAFEQEVVPRGFRPYAVRIDSGDIVQLSKKAREMLDEAGFEDCKIVASNSLDEYSIQEMLSKGACVDQFGVGERLITSASDSVFGGVYKLVAIKRDGEIIPKIKISETTGKINIPGVKELHRLYDNHTNEAVADIISLRGEEIDVTKPYEAYDVYEKDKKVVLKNFSTKKLLTPIFEKGKCVYDSPNIEEIKSYCRQQVDTLSNTIKSLKNPEHYPVYLSPGVWQLKNELFEEKKV